MGRYRVSGRGEKNGQNIKHAPGTHRRELDHGQWIQLQTREGRHTHWKLGWT